MVPEFRTGFLALGLLIVYLGDDRRFEEVLADALRRLLILRGALEDLVVDRRDVADLDDRAGAADVVASQGPDVSPTTATSTSVFRFKTFIFNSFVLFLVSESRFRGTHGENIGP